LHMRTGYALYEHLLATALVTFLNAIAIRMGCWRVKQEVSAK